MEGRVRADPRRTVGNANALATGQPVPTFTTISDATLARYQDIANNAAQLAQDAMFEERRGKLEVSRARVNTWGDTLQAKRKQYITNRSNRLEADELRRQLIDEEEAEFREANRQQRLQESNQQLFLRDERGRQMRSAVLANEVRQTQEWQMSIQAEKKAAVDEDARDYAAAVKRGAAKEIEEKQIAAQLIKDRLAKVKQEQYAMLEQAMDQRRSENKKLVLDGEEIRRAAEAEALENSARRDQRRQNEKSLKEDLVKQFSPRHSPRQKLQLATESVTHVSPTSIDGSILKYQAHKESQATMLADLARSRQERHDTLVQHATASLHTITAGPTKKDVTVERFSTAPSISNRLIDESHMRELTIAQHKREVIAAPSPRTMRSTLGMSVDTAVERNYNELRSPRYRERLDNQVAMLDRFDQEQRMAQRQEAQYLSMIHQMQAAEKAHQKHIDKDADIQDALSRRAGVEAEDALFREFVEAHLPENLTPRLAKTARGHNNTGGKYTGRNVYINTGE
jgi:hypothetical protein